MVNYGKGTNVCLHAIKCLKADKTSRSTLNSVGVHFLHASTGLESIPDWSRENSIYINVDSGVRTACGSMVSWSRENRDGGGGTQLGLTSHDECLIG